MTIIKRKTMFYAGIGSRETPGDILEIMQAIAQILGQKGWTLRSGFAPGADQAFALGADGYSMVNYTPWKGFENAPDNDPRFIALDEMPDTILMQAFQIAKAAHPNWDACSNAAKRLHTRNVFQVLGNDLRSRSRMIICWTKGGQPKGGTAQAIRIANSLDIPVFNLGKDVDNVLSTLDTFVQGVINE